MSRYVVTELEGYSFSGGHRGSKTKVGLSCHVIATAWNRRLVAAFRTEDVLGGVAQYVKRERVRRAPAELAERLNGALAEAA